MNKRGVAALEALIAAAQILLLAATVTGLLLNFWRSWGESTSASRRRQWTTVAFAYLDEDIRAADRVIVTPSVLRICRGEEEITYQITGDNSFYRGLGQAYYPMAKLNSVCWRLEGDLLWIELVYPGESYQCCYCLEGKR